MKHLGNHFKLLLLIQDKDWHLDRINGIKIHQLLNQHLIKMELKDGSIMY